MTARSSYESIIATAGQTYLAALLSDEQTKQTSIDAQKSVVGHNDVNGNATLVSTTLAANAAKYTNDLAAERARQASVDAARATLRNSGDLGPF